MKRKKVRKRGNERRKKIVRDMIISWSILIALLAGSIYGVTSAINAVQNKTSQSGKEVLETRTIQINPEEEKAEREPIQVLEDIVAVSKEYNFDKEKAADLQELLREAGYKISLDSESNLLYIDAWAEKREILDGQKTVYVHLIEIDGKNEEFPSFKIEKLENDEIFEEIADGDHFKLYPNFESWFTLREITQGSYSFEKPVKTD